MNKQASYKKGFIKRAMEHGLTEKQANGVQDWLAQAQAKGHNALFANPALAHQDHMNGLGVGSAVGGLYGLQGGALAGAGVGGLLGAADDRRDENGDTHRVRNAIHGLLGGGVVGGIGGGVLGAGAGGAIGYSVPSVYDRA